MKNMLPDKYTIAWFKLAECVSRGEKERALGVYRLLAYSLQDVAFARQLQGDILLAFNDTTAAVGHYAASAQLYQNDNRLLEAAALHEHILMLVSDKRDCLTTLIDLYSRLGMSTKTMVHTEALCALLLSDGELAQALQIISALDTQNPNNGTAILGQQLLIALLQQGTHDAQFLAPYVQKIINYHLNMCDTQALQRFLTTVHVLHEPSYIQACRYMESQSPTITVLEHQL